MGDAIAPSDPIGALVSITSSGTIEVSNFPLATTEIYFDVEGFVSAT